MERSSYFLPYKFWPSYVHALQDIVFKRIVGTVHMRLSTSL